MSYSKTWNRLWTRFLLKVVSIGLPSLYAQTKFSSHAQISLIVNVNSDITGQWFGLFVIYLKMIVFIYAAGRTLQIKTER